MTHGIAVVDKGVGWTSHDVVAKSRGLLGTKKVGHAGTLDPSATGVLVLGIGKATRLLRYLGDLPKSYEGELVLGVETNTLDAEGMVVATHDMAGVTRADVAAAAEGFVGLVMQIPPMVSAVQVGGRRLHELARAGIEVERKPRSVTIHRLDVAATEEAGIYHISVDCSSGTYIRTLAADIGTVLGGGAHLRELRRTAIGSFSLTDAVSIEGLTMDRVMAPVAAVRHLAAVVVDEHVAAAVGHGKVLATEALGVEGEGPWAVLDGEGRLLAVYAAYTDGTAKPDVVLS